MNNNPNNNNNNNNHNHNKNTPGGDKIVSEVISWIVTVVMLSVFFPVGIIMLITRLKKYGVFDTVKNSKDDFKQQAEDFKRQAQDIGRQAQNLGRQAQDIGRQWRGGFQGGSAREQWERQQEEARRRAGQEAQEEYRQDGQGAQSAQDEAQRRYEQKQDEAKRRFVEKQQEEASRRASGAYQAQARGQASGAKQADWSYQASGAAQQSAGRTSRSYQDSGGAGRVKQKFRHLGQSAQRALKRSKTLRVVLALAGAGLLLGAVGAVAYNVIVGLFGGGLFGFGPAVGLALGGGVFAVASASKKRRERQYLRYLAIIGKDDYMEIDRLAAITREKPRDVMKNLQDMIDDYWFGDYAYIDMSLGALILSYEARMRYAGHEDPVSEEATAEESRSEYEKIIDEIQDLNDRIDDEVMSAKIDRIRETTASIFRVVEEHPEKLPQIKTFMNYYLPTTLKLLDSYSQFEAQAVAGDNLSSAKASIEGILDNLVQTFEKQLDTLFGADALDVSSEIDVLETMMSKDGFIGGSAFQVKPE